MKRILWDDLKIVIFDVDGTLYDQKKLRKIMLARLLLFYLPRPWKFKDLVVLYCFRKEREVRAGFEFRNLNAEQFEWCCEKTGYQLEYVKSVVEKWMFQIPNDYLQSCVYVGVKTFLEELKKKGINTAVYSDYPAREKLKSMTLNFDLVISSTDNLVNSLKPAAKGLKLVLSQFNIEDTNYSLYIGDRLDLDGKCAKNAEVPFLFFQKNDKQFYSNLCDQIRFRPKNKLESINERGFVKPNY